MKLLLEGSLSETLTIKDLLIGILQAEAPGVSVLQLFLDINNQYGEIFFLGGHFVVGCSLSTTEIAADESFNHLLQLKEANFYYYACDSLEALPANKPLKIDLKDLLDNWQIRRPISSNDLLDKIFNKVENLQESIAVSKRPSATKEEMPALPKETFAQEQLRFPFTDKQSDIDWELVNPLLVGGAPGDKAIGSIGNDWEQNLRSTHELRSITAGSEWQRKLRDLIVILIMLLIAVVVILCFAWLLINSPTDVTTKHFQLQFLKHGPKRHSTH